MRKLADDILRQVVCDCGNYRHHGVDWMPEGSGEGLSNVLVQLRIAENYGFQAGVESGRKEVLDIIFEHDTRIHANLGEGFTDRSDVELSLQGRKQEK